MIHWVWLIIVAWLGVVIGYLAHALMSQCEYPDIYFDEDEHPRNVIIHWRPRGDE